MFCRQWRQSTLAVVGVSQGRDLKKACFWTFYGLLLAVTTIGGMEFMASYLTPPWPAYELRPVAVNPAGSVLPGMNSWGLRDQERSLEKPSGIRFRSVLVGDSFVEGIFAPPLAEEVESRWHQGGVNDMEAVNLGVSGTGPPQYYYRMKAIALKLHPDAIVEMFYSGNDFVPEKLSSWSIPPVIAERPMQSLLGAVAPHLTWLAVSRLRLSEIARGNNDVPDEQDKLNDILKKPLPQQSDLLAKHLKKYYYPDMSESLLQEILSRGNDRFWEPFEGNEAILAGWMPASMVLWETSKWPMAHDAEEADRMVDQSLIDNTMTWLTGAADLAKSKGIKFLIAVAPMGWGDPQYVDYWKPWPRYYNFNVQRAATHHRLVAALRARGLAPIDLEENLGGVAGSYRITDGHWTALGTSVVAKRIANELIELRRQAPSEPGIVAPE